jgi:capsular exopolysaccharide synthesis family protein
MQNDKHPHSQQAQRSPAYAPDLLKAADTLDLREFGRTLFRRRRMIFLVTGIIILLALLITLFSKPVYRATATLQIERESTKVVNIDFLGAGDIRDTRDFYQTQFELIHSRSLAAQVITELKLEEKLTSTSLFSQLKVGLGITDTSNKQTALEDVLLENLTVEPVKNSRLVAVSYTSSDAAQAAQIANEVVKTFKKMNTDRRDSTTSNAKSYLEKKVKETEERLVKSEERLNSKNNEQTSTALGDETSMSSKALKELDDELTQLTRQRIEQKSKIDMLADKNHPLATRIQVLDKDTSYLQTLVQKIDRLTAQQEEQPIANIAEQIKKFENDIEIELTTKRKSIEYELEASKLKENALQLSIAKAKADIREEQDKSTEFQRLRREIEDQQDDYKELQKRLTEVNLAGGFTANNIAVIDPAQMPQNKFKPNLSSNLLFGTLLGLLLGVSAAFMREFLDDTVKDINELERTTQLPVLGVMEETVGTTAAQLATSTISKPRSAIAEAFRSLRTSLRFLQQTDTTPLIVITSASPNEGKTTTASNLACAYASAGNRVLLIDADLRNPSLHKTLGVHASNGLANYLSGALDSRELIQMTDIPNLYLLPAGTLPDDPAELLSSPHMHTLLDSVKRDFDQIIIDSPPVLGLADALILAELSSATLLTVRAEHTRMATLQNALIRLRRANAPLTGILLNRVDLDHGYGNDYGGYVYHAENHQAKLSTAGKLFAALKKL